MQKHIVIDGRIRRAGTGRYTDRLLEHLQAIDPVNRYTILVEPDDPWQPKAANFTAVPCRFKQFSFNPIDQLAFPWQLYRLKPDLVHFTMTQQPIFYFGRAVTTTHDLTMFEYARPGRLPKWIHGLRMLGYRFLFWWSHKKSSRILTPCKYVAQRLAKLQPFTSKKTVVTHEAADLLLGKAVRPKNVRKPFIFHVGSPFPHKNIERLVEAFTKLKETYPDLNLVLAGKREYYFEKLEELVSTYSTKNSVIFPGRVSDAELKWLFAHAEAYVLPSLSEGFGLPGVEAMLHGCPLVSSNATCLPEVYGSAALYFDPKNVNDMAGAITEVLDDEKLRAKLIEKGRAQAAKYSWSKMTEETLEVYKTVLD